MTYLRTIATAVSIATCTNEMYNASCVKYNIQNKMAQESGKLIIKPNAVSVMDSRSAF